MGGEEQSLQKKIQHLQNMLGEINRYLQGASSKPPGMISRLLDEKTRITSQIRELNNMTSNKEKGARFGGGAGLPSLGSHPQKTEREKDPLFLDAPPSDPLEERIEIADLLREMGLDPRVDPEVKKVLLGGADIFIDNFIATSCSIARNKGQEDVTKEDIILAMKMERHTEMYNTTTYNKQREPDKEHARRLQMIKKDHKRTSNK
ncbi:transcription initiation factor TFIID subunit 12 [Nematocida displodere]|uniref:Transcription initiation factor TFIID subunit 12 n=1 Tax=Nematocida displodere TaxID=1805483 RepID=A0A177EAZ8_9MICR|nr:transcription initiation factor TFIID subunit 12 [Nematocida displodere]